MVARGYAYASAAEQGLSYNADEHFSEKGRVRRIMDAIGGRKALVSRVLASEIKKEDVGHVEEKRTMLGFEMGILFERALQYGAYVFKPEDARRRIDDLQRVQDGGVIDYDDAHRVLFMNGICRGLGDDFIQARLAEKDEEDSWLKGKIRVAVSDLETRIDSYEQLLAEERDEIEHQFPVVIMLEGKEAGVIDTGMPLLQERVGTQTIKPGAIREIRVPLRNVSTVEGWVVENGLAEVKVTPLEYYEIHEVVESVKK
jgi:hypothetical protein